MPDGHHPASRLGALLAAVSVDTVARAEAGQAGLHARFEAIARECFPDASDAEIVKKAGFLYGAHMARLAYLSAKARRNGRKA